MHNWFLAKPKLSPWNKGKMLGQKPPLKLKEIWAIRFNLENQGRDRDIAMFNLAIDSKLRSCDLVKLRVNDLCNGREPKTRSSIVQQKTGRPVTFEISKATRKAVLRWIAMADLSYCDFLFPSRVQEGANISTHQYARLVKSWVKMAGLDSRRYGTHSLRRTKATLIYRQTKSIRAVQLLLGHTKLESTVRYLGIDVEDALEIAEAIEI